MLALELKLKVANAGEEILVTASRPHGEAESINETRTADNLLQVMPSEVITSLPNANVADAIGRFPSVSLYRIEGEGVYIQVRGTEPRLTNVTVDGITIPAPEPTIRAVRLDVIPSGMVDSIEMNKTLLANMDGNGIGASVNLHTKEAGERPTVNLFGDGGYTNILNGRANYDFGGTVGKRFGGSKRFGILGDATYDYQGRGIDNIQPALDPLSTLATPFYDNNTIREYRYYRTRYGFDGSADYRVTNDTGIYLRGFYTDLKDWGDKWYYSPVSTAIGGNAASPIYPGAGTKSSSPKFYTSSKRPNASVGTLIFGGRTVHKDSLFTYQISASRSYEIDSAGNPKADFSWVGPNVFCNYIPSAQTDLYHPHFGNCDNASSSPLLNAANWQFKDITTSTGKNTNLQLTTQTSYSKSYNWAGHFGTVDTGFKFSNGHQTQDATENVYDSFGTTAPLMTQLLSPFSNTDYFSGSYFGGHYGQVSDFNQALNYTLANYQGNLDGQKTAAATYPNLFHTRRADYVRLHHEHALDFGKLHVNTGLRIENTRTLTFGYNVTFFGTYSSKTGTYSGGASNVDCNGNKAPTAPAAGNCYTFTGVNNNPSYLDLLPSVQFRYGLDEGLGSSRGVRSRRSSSRPLSAGSLRHGRLHGKPGFGADRQPGPSPGARQQLRPAVRELPPSSRTHPGRLLLQATHRASGSGLHSWNDQSRQPSGGLLPQLHPKRDQSVPGRFHYAIYEWQKCLHLWAGAELPTALQLSSGDPQRPGPAGQLQLYRIAGEGASLAFRFAHLTIDQSPNTSQAEPDVRH